MVLAAVKEHGMSLEYASGELQADKEVVAEAVKRHRKALEYASEEIREEIEKLLKK